METYAEKLGEKPFDWNEFLNNAINGDLERGDTLHHKASTLANNWVTCVCGNQCDIIPRKVSGDPYDEFLFHLGVDFSVNIEVAEWAEAKVILEQIEKRSKEIIDQINKSKKS